MLDIANPDADTAYETIESADGTKIAYEVRGAGAPVILIGGASNDRHSGIAGVPMAELLADSFSAISFDRRGRGASGNEPPYGVAREIDDVAALIVAAGAPVFIFGHSSGGGLALEAAAARLPVRGVAVYEPPYAADAAADAESAVFATHVKALIEAGRYDDAQAFFMAGTGMPDFMIDAARQSPLWPGLMRMAPTLLHDISVMSVGGSSQVPAERLAGLAIPVLAMAGGESPEWMIAIARAIADAVPIGRFLEVRGQNHMVPNAVVSALNSEPRPPARLRPASCPRADRTTSAGTRPS
jgi:pimeloyl-ACP methyl ester carboxylesterase